MLPGPLLWLRANPWNPFLDNLLKGVIWSWEYINHRLRVEIWYTEDLGYRMSALFPRGSSITNKLYVFLFNSSQYFSKISFEERLPLITQPFPATLGGSYWSFPEKASAYAMKNEVPHSRKFTQQGIFFLPWARISMQRITGVTIESHIPISRALNDQEKRTCAKHRLMQQCKSCK